MAILLQLKTKPSHNPSLFFSTSSSSSSPFSSYLKDLKHTLKHQPQQPPPPPPPPPPKTSPSTTFQQQQQQQDLSLDEIRRNLSEFRRRTAAPEQKPAEMVSFQELYNRSTHRRPPGPDGDSGSGRGKPQVSLDAVRESLRKLGAARPGGERNEADRMSLPAFKEALSLRPSDSSAAAPGKVIGGTSELPELVFGREMREKSERYESAAMASARREYSRIYSYGELGEKLKKLRPEGKDSFSLEELNERLMRLREIELEEAESNVKGSVSYKDLRECLIKINETNDDKAKKSLLQRFDILGQLGKTPAYFLDPPKEHLVEKYFHPDNMSSAEKLKIELAKVRDEFKMSESDCGSARVQVAQLTTKIKHLSAVLHKKDVHSRKGLLAMVQRRKRLLKYLRRTDWDSYCFVISKLGLRDNPDHSHKTQAKSRFTNATSS